MISSLSVFKVDSFAVIKHADHCTKNAINGFYFNANGIFLICLFSTFTLINVCLWFSLNREIRTLSLRVVNGCACYVLINQSLVYL